MIFQEESGDQDTLPSYLCDAELDCSVKSEKNQRSVDKLITLLEKICCQLNPFLCVTQERGDPCTNKVRQVHAEKNQVPNWKTKQSGFSLKDKKRKFSLILEPRFRNTNFKPILIGEVSRNSMEFSNLSEEKLIILLQVMNNPDLINYFLHEQLSEQDRELREAHVKSLNGMEELKRFQGSTFDTISMRKWIEDRDTILELTGKIQESNCMNDSRDFKDAVSVRSGQSHVASQSSVSPPFEILGEC